MASNEQNSVNSESAGTSQHASNQDGSEIMKDEHKAEPQPLVNGDISHNDSTAEYQSPEVGTSSIVMKLWEGKSANDRTVWLTEPPEVEEEDDSVSESQKYAITLLHRDILGNGKHSLETIVMRSPVLRDFLEETIPNISSYFSELEQGIAIRTPFRLLFWHLDHINAAAKGSDKKLSEAAALLQSVLNAEFRELLGKQKQILAKQEVNFDILWTLFKPGITCLTTYNGFVVAGKVFAIEFSHDAMGHLYYRVKYSILAWDGEHLGWQDAHTDIFEFNGRRKIRDLEIYPIEFDKDPNITNWLIDRGKRFVEIAVKEPHMMNFNGEALDREKSPMWWQGEQKKKMSERLILDAKAYNHYFRRISASKWKKREELDDKFMAANQDQLMYCCPEFHTFALQRKKWVRVWIDDLAEVVFNDAAYPSLVLPKDYKELLLAFAEAQIDGYGFDDVIAGKGQGILMLLAGPPGTGKTLTAEAMSEHMKRPLYSVSTGELGSSAQGMENELDRVLELATRWNAVLLMDEADVFLERRTDNDIQRNSIVSVFLRKLEYYRGIMFLTTNRIHSFDEAFKSRIHIAIRYPDLDTDARRTIWQNFLKRAQDIYNHGVEVSDEDMERLAQKKLNGREIRNIVKSAQLLASRSKQPLRQNHLDIVWKVEHEDSVWNELDEQSRKAFLH